LHVLLLLLPLVSQPNHYTRFVLTFVWVFIFFYFF